MRDGVGAAYGIKLVEKRADVELGGVNRNAEPAGDDLVRGSFCEQRQHLEFAGCQMASPSACAAVVEAITRTSAGSPSDQPKTRHIRQKPPADRQALDRRC